eukprot:scaffold114837_cov25-Tisochrysis_lutea.AAC.2
MQVLASLRKEIGNLPEATGEEDDEAYERVMTDRITANQQHGEALKRVCCKGHGNHAARSHSHAAHEQVITKRVTANQLHGEASKRYAGRSQEYAARITAKQQHGEALKRICCKVAFAPAYERMPTNGITAKQQHSEGWSLANRPPNISTAILPEC